MQGFDAKELFVKFRFPLLILLAGLILAGGGLIYFKSGLNLGATDVEVLGTSNEDPDIHQDLTVEISGEVITPGVYKLPDGSRVDDLLVAAGGFSSKADRIWTDKYLNRAAKLTDGQKIFIPKVNLIPNVNQQTTTSTAKIGGGDQTVSSTISADSNRIININTASLKDLDSLPGIGQSYGQSIIEHRPYSTVQELVSKGAIKQSLLEKIKGKISVY